MITTVCKISYGSQTVPPIVPAVQGDTGRAISFEIADFTPPAGATATYFILKPSGEAIYNSATITDNSILCELTAQSLAEAGENRMQVRVLQGENIVTSFEVILMVRTFLGDDAMESGTEMNIFDQAVEQATKQFQENAEQIVEEVIESIPADYTELTEEVDELNERLSNVTDITTTTADNTNTWQQGAISLATGESYQYRSRLRTGFLTFSDAIGFSAKTGYEFAVFVYAQDDTYQGAIDNNGNLTKTDSNNIYHDSCLIINYNDYKFRVILRNKVNPSATMTIAEGTNCLVVLSPIMYTDRITANFNTDIEELETSVSQVSDSVSQVNNSVYDIVEGKNTIVMFHKNGTDWMELGAINGSGTDVANDGTHFSYRTGFISCRESNVITSVMALITPSTDYYHYVAFYDANKGFLNRTGGNQLLSVVATAPTNAFYFRVSLTYVGENNVSSYDLKNEANNEIDTATPKNKWYVLGDSISAGYYSMTASMAQEQGATLDYTSPVTSPSGEVTGSVWDSSLSHNYWGYANAWKLHRELVGKAYPGQGYFRTASNSQNGVYVVTHNDFSDAGLITVAWGFNDWHYNQPRGNHDLIDSSVPYPTENYDTSQITTVNQAIWFCLGELIRQATNAKIIVQTPMNGWAYGGDFASNWGIGTAKTQSGTLANIHDDIVYWANYYGLQILEMTYNNSIVNRRNIKDTIIDGSHPSDNAHKQLGRHVAIALDYC